MTSASENSKLLPVIPRSTFAGDEGGACREFQQAKYPFKWRKHVCTRCGTLRAEHRASSGKATAEAEATVDVKEEEERHLPPRKRLMLRFLRFQLATLAASGSKEEEEEELEEELEEGEIRSPAAAITKGKRCPRRKRWDAP